MDQAINIKNGVLTAVAVAGSALANALGGWDAGLKVLVALMVADYITGVLVAALVRERRTELLRDTDWTQSLDSPVSAAGREEMRVYRQALRDITEQAGFPLEVIWPETPTVIKGDPGQGEDNA